MTVRIGSALIAVGLWAVPSLAHAKRCFADAVQVGNACVDRYEASAWETADPATIKRVQRGKVAAADQLAGVATQRGVASDDYGAGCPDSGSGCVAVFAVSIAGVSPSAFASWLQAAAACRNSGKRLATNHEWQMAALGTPDGAPCNVSSGTVVATGVAGCVSDVGAFDMVGNLWEWVGDWVPRSTGSANWGGFSDDEMSFVGADPAPGGPGVLARGGDNANGTAAGPFAVDGGNLPTSGESDVGFRCARDL
jgi:hypothetical protein